MQGCSDSVRVQGHEVVGGYPVHKAHDLHLHLPLSLMHQMHAPNFMVVPMHRVPMTGLFKELCCFSMRLAGSQDLMRKRTWQLNSIPQRVCKEVSSLYFLVDAVKQMLNNAFHPNLWPGLLASVLSTLVSARNRSKACRCL